MPRNNIGTPRWNKLRPFFSGKTQIWGPHWATLSATAIRPQVYAPLISICIVSAILQALDWTAKAEWALIWLYMFPVGCPPTAGRIRGEILGRFFPLFVSFVLIGGKTEAKQWIAGQRNFFPILFCSLSLVGKLWVEPYVCRNEWEWTERNRKGKEFLQNRVLISVLPQYLGALSQCCGFESASFFLLRLPARTK